MLAILCVERRRRVLLAEGLFGLVFLRACCHAALPLQANSCSDVSVGFFSSTFSASLPVPRVSLHQCAVAPTILVIGASGPLPGTRQWQFFDLEVLSPGVSLSAALY